MSITPPAPSVWVVSMIGTDLTTAQQHLEAGTVVGLPTDTVYGLAANAYDAAAVARVFAMKGRPRSQSLLVLAAGAAQALALCAGWDEDLERLAKAYWPGPLTLLVPQPLGFPPGVTSSSSLGLRVPAHPLTLSLLARLPFPLVATSANPSGAPSPTTAAQVHGYFRGTCPYILDGGACAVGIASTILGKEEGQFILYRAGAVPTAALERRVGPLRRIAHAARA